MSRDKAAGLVPVDWFAAKSRRLLQTDKASAPAARKDCAPNRENASDNQSACAAKCRPHSARRFPRKLFHPCHNACRRADANCRFDLSTPVEWKSKFDNCNSSNLWKVVLAIESCHPSEIPRRQIPAVCAAREDNPCPSTTSRFLRRLKCLSAKSESPAANRRWRKSRAAEVQRRAMWKWKPCSSVAPSRSEQFCDARNRISESKSSGRFQQRQKPELVLKYVDRCSCKPVLLRNYVSNDADAEIQFSFLKIRKVKFQFDAATIRPLIQLANSELKKL